MIKETSHTAGVDTHMSKIAQYLNQHLSGETSSDAAVRQAYGVDSGVLGYTPELVVFPRSTSDIRKVLRFSWQLAEKGHTVPVVVRGGGADATGAAVGAGVMVVVDHYLQDILELDSKQRLVRLQPGVTAAIARNSLGLHGLTLPAFLGESRSTTIGGLIASGSSGIASAKYGSIDRQVKQLEVVLTSGDILQTGQVSRRELNRKKGLQTHEGDIYRKIDALLDDNQELVAQIASSSQVGRIGYPGIADVRAKDGSIDLTPLFIGSQGTLGIISEIIIAAEPLSTKLTGALAVFESLDKARDAVDAVLKACPAVAQLLDHSLLDLARAHGKQYGEAGGSGAVAIVFGFDDFSDRARERGTTKLLKTLSPLAISTSAIADRDELLRILQLSNDSNPLLRASTGAALNILPDAYVPASHLGNALEGIAALAEKLHLSVVTHVNLIDQTVHVRPVLNLSKVTERQKAVKLASEFAGVVEKYNGSVAINSAEGRLGAAAAHATLDEEEQALYAKVRAIFDEFNILGQGVKSPNDPHDLAKHLVGATKK